MRFLAERINATIGQVNSSGYREIARKVEGAFTCCRKLPLFALVLTLLERRGLTLSMEIRVFKEKAIVEDRFSQTAYSNARQKLVVYRKIGY